MLRRRASKYPQAQSNNAFMLMKQDLSDSSAKRSVHPVKRTGMPAPRFFEFSSSDSS